ncbi:hypothetical protein BDA96_04G367000 [Sorghum bicolor]|uniref:Uncharacterized protein n=1 Tax=Sorghum bicolor TaxID=4558 RepID=A0A921RA18_SORBI|nr:hypothetical protein BDA96_04G367000 [Sorghum bicolor]
MHMSICSSATSHGRPPRRRSLSHRRQPHDAAVFAVRSNNPFNNIFFIQQTVFFSVMVYHYLPNERQSTLCWRRSDAAATRSARGCFTTARARPAAPGLWLRLARVQASTRWSRVAPADKASRACSITYSSIFRYRTG